MDQQAKVSYWTAGYNFWKASPKPSEPGMDYPQEYGPPQAFEDPACAGFYRKGVYQKEDGKRAKRVGWEPVAIFQRAGTLTAIVGDARDCREVEPVSIWTYVCDKSISEGWYRSVAERGEPWPDSHEAQPAPAVPAEVAEVLKEAVDEGISPAERIAATVKADRELIKRFEKIDSDEMASRARSLQNKLLDSRSAAEKAYNAENRPLLDEQKRLREIWFPIRDLADGGCKFLAGKMGEWEDTKREAAKRAQREAEEAARKHAEATRKAEAAGKPAPEPPPEVKPNTPPPAAQIRGGAGRAASVSVQKFVTEVDVMKVCEQFKTNPDVIDLMTKLAEKAIRAGLDVPGAKWEERSIVR